MNIDGVHLCVGNSRLIGESDLLSPAIFHWGTEETEQLQLRFLQRALCLDEAFPPHRYFRHCSHQFRLGEFPEPYHLQYFVFLCLCDL